MMRNTSMFKRPTPTPPKMQLIHMPVMGTMPANGLRLSCIQLTDPLATDVQSTAHVGPAEVPNRSSLPSKFPSD